MSLKVFPSAEILESLLVRSLSFICLGVSLTLEVKPCFHLETSVKGLLQAHNKGAAGQGQGVRLSPDLRLSPGDTPSSSVLHL